MTSKNILLQQINLLTERFYRRSVKLRSLYNVDRSLEIWRYNMRTNLNSNRILLRFKRIYSKILCNTLGSMTTKDLQLLVFANLSAILITQVTKCLSKHVVKSICMILPIVTTRQSQFLKSPEVFRLRYYK
jgi:hypothetical protein